MARPVVRVVGLGPAGPELTPPAAREALEEDVPRWLRTRRHPAAEAWPDLPSFDARYEQAADFASLYEGIAAELARAAAEHGGAVLAVPGSPSVGESVVELLRRRDDVALELVAAPSFADLAWARLGVDPLAVGATLVDGQRFVRATAGAPGPFLVGQCWSVEVLSDVKLAFEEPPPVEPVLLHHLGLADEVVVAVPWSELDRTLVPDHLTAVWVPRLGEGPAAALVALDDLARTLRARCPWDAEQTHDSLAGYLREESYEVLDAIAGLDGGAASYEALEEELGDLLYQVCAHAVLAAEQGAFDLEGVARHVHDKLVARHPHVFAAASSPTAPPRTAATAGAVLASWEAAKRAEKGRPSLVDDIPAGLPALARAQTLERRLLGAGPPAMLPEGTMLPPGESEVDGGGGVAPLGTLAAAVAALVDRERDRPADTRPADTRPDDDQPRSADGVPAPRAAGRSAPGEEDAFGRLLYAAVQVAAGRGVDAEEALRRFVELRRQALSAAERRALDPQLLRPPALG